MRLASSTTPVTSAYRKCAEPGTGRIMKAKIFEVALHKLPSGVSPASALEEQLNVFLEQRPNLRVLTTHVNTIVAPAEPSAMPSSTAASVIIFCTVFYQE